MRTKLKLLNTKYFASCFHYIGESMHQCKFNEQEKSDNSSNVHYPQSVGIAVEVKMASDDGFICFVYNYQLRCYQNSNAGFMRLVTFYVSKL